MQRSGGRVGRPFGHVSIGDLEAQVRANRKDRRELMAVLAELGRRHSKRAGELKDLVRRLLDEKSLEAEHPASKTLL